jgi:hypothetical protein
MRALFAFAFLTFPTLSFAADAIRVTITPSAALPKGGEVAIVPAGKPGPATKGFNAVLQTKEFGKEVEIVGAGPFDVYYTPKGGLPVLAVAGWEVKSGSNELRPGSHLGTVFVRGDDLPRSGGLVVTATGDPGPGEKGHSAIQKVPDYKEDLVVRDGFYSVWLISANGAKSQRIADKIRVLAGRQTVVPE